MLVIAPVNGIVAERAVQVGQRVLPGQSLMDVVPVDDLWIDANFKESQLRDLRIGQPVEVTPDVYQGRVVLHGTVAGIDAGDGVEDAHELWRAAGRPRRPPDAAVMP